MDLNEDEIPCFFQSAFTEMRDRIHNDMIEGFDVAQEHIKSFNEFLREGIPEIVRSLPIATAQHGDRFFTMQFWNPVVSTPRVEAHKKRPRALCPDESKKRASGYAGFLHVDVHIKEYMRPEDSFKRKIMGCEQDPAEIGCRMRFWTDLDFERPTAASKLVAYNLYRAVRIVKQPIMLFSAACNMSYGLADERSTRAETGGEFLVRGAPKLVTGISRLADNFIYVVSNSKNAAQADIHCRSFERRFFSTTNLTLKLLLPNLKNATFGIAINVFLPFIQKIVPLALMLRALGFDLPSFKNAMLKIHLGDKIPDLDFKLQALFVTLPAGCTTQDAKIQLGLLALKSEHVPARDRLIHTANYFLERSLFSNTISFEAKGLLFARAVVKLFATTSIVAGKALLPFDNKDHVASKRLDTVGILWTTLLRQVISNHINFISKHAELQLKHSTDNGTTFTCQHILDLIDLTTMTGRLNFALSTGQWSATRASQPVSRKNVCQLHQNQTFLGQAAHFGKSTSGVNSEAKQKSIRDVQKSSWAKFDPSDTPDGKPCGLVSNYSFGVRISIGVPPATVLKAIEPFLPALGFVATEQTSVHGTVDATDKWAFCFEHALVGWVSNGLGLCRTLLALRRIGQIASEVSISVNHQEQEVCVQTSGSRLLSVLLVVDARTQPIWADFVTTKCPIDVATLESLGLVEFLDASEAENTVVTLGPEDLAERQRACPHVQFTHMQIHASTIFGISTAMIPFAELNHAARTSFASVMGKQAIDDFVQPSSQSAKNVLDNGQVALIETRMAKVAGGLSRVKGNMVKLAIFTSGGNQEDAVDMSKASRDRGLFLVTRFRPERDQQSNKSKGFTGETFERPNSGTTVGMQYSPTDHLMEDNGLAHLGTLVQTGNIVIGKTTALRSKKGTRKAADTTTTTTTTAATTTENGNDSDPENAGDGNGHGHGGRGRERVPTKRDISLIHQGDEAVISNAMKTTTLTGEQNVKIETRQTREILVGDKLQAHSQKATISRIVPMEDLPWSEVDGTVADIYVHPISELARRTGGHLAELLMSKVVALRPSQARRLGLIDGTPFARISRRRDQDAGGSLLADPWPCEFDDILNDVKKAYGFDVVEHDGYIPFHFLRTGKERFRCGMTGRVIDCLVMVGIIQMHRLLQFVMDKIYAAYTAQKTILLQYRGGRADQGGMRVGSMEVDVLAAHGVAFIMYESLVTLADPVELYFCRHCGIMCLVVVDSRSSCSVCNKEGVAVVVKTVEGFRSFLFNLAAMNVLTRLNLKTVPRGLVK